MEFPCNFHAGSCWLHAGFADLAYWWIISMTIPWNLHGTSMEYPWNLHQSECMIKVNHMEIARNLYQFSMGPVWNLHEICIN
jgi:hypothetical protein